MKPHFEGMFAPQVVFPSVTISCAAFAYGCWPHWSAMVFSMFSGAAALASWWTRQD